MFYIIGAVFIGAIVGWASERIGFTRHGYVIAITLGIGGAIIAWFIQGALGITLGLGRTGASVLGAAAMLLLAKMKR